MKHPVLFKFYFHSHVVRLHLDPKKNFKKKKQYTHQLNIELTLQPRGLVFLEIYASDLSGSFDQFAILGNFPPSPSITQHFSSVISISVDRCECWVIIREDVGREVTTNSTRGDVS